MPRALADSGKGEVHPFVWWIIGGILDGGKGKPPLVVEGSCVGIWSPDGIPTWHLHRPSVQGGREKK
jgi:hypothetical protein